jgi:hypothetical protein
VLSQFNTCAQAREEAAQGQLRDAQGGSGRLSGQHGHSSGLLTHGLRLKHRVLRPGNGTGIW